MPSRKRPTADGPGGTRPPSRWPHRCPPRGLRSEPSCYSAAMARETELTEPLGLPANTEKPIGRRASVPEEDQHASAYHGGMRAAVALAIPWPSNYCRPMLGRDARICPFSVQVHVLGTSEMKTAEHWPRIGFEIGDAVLIDVSVAARNIFRYSPTCRMSSIPRTSP